MTIRIRKDRHRHDSIEELGSACESMFSFLKAYKQEME